MWITILWMLKRIFNVIAIILMLSIFFGSVISLKYVIDWKSYCQNWNWINYNNIQFVEIQPATTAIKQTNNIN